MKQARQDFFGFLPLVMDAEAAAFYLGFSKKTLEKYVAAGKVATSRYESPESEDRLLDKVMFDRQALEKFKENYLR